MSVLFYTDFLALIRRFEQLGEWVRLQQDAGRDKLVEAELERICQQEVGLPLPVIRHSSPEDISELLNQSVNVGERSILLAEILVLDGNVYCNAGDAVGQVRATLQAFCLLGEAMKNLSMGDNAVFAAKLRTLAAKLREAGDDPYLQQKLRQFGC